MKTKRKKHQGKPKGATYADMLAFCGAKMDKEG